MRCRACAPPGRWSSRPTRRCRARADAWAASSPLAASGNATLSGRRAPRPRSRRRSTLRDASVPVQTAEDVRADPAITAVTRTFAYLSHSASPPASSPSSGSSSTSRRGSDVRSSPLRSPGGWVSARTPSALARARARRHPPRSRPSRRRDLGHRGPLVAATSTRSRPSRPNRFSRVPRRLIVAAGAALVGVALWAGSSPTGGGACQLRRGDAPCRLSAPPRSAPAL